MQQFKNISRRGTEKVLYITLGEEKEKRAAQLTFINCIIESHKYFNVKKS